MGTVQIVLGILLLVSAVFLVVAVLMQNGKSHGLSGAISGGAETFFGKQKGSTIEKRLSKLTTIVAIIFVVIVLVMYIMQDQTDFDKLYNDYLASTTTSAGTTSDTTGTTSDTTSATESGNSSETTGAPAETTAAE